MLFGTARQVHPVFASEGMPAAHRAAAPAPIEGTNDVFFCNLGGTGLAPDWPHRETHVSWRRGLSPADEEGKRAALQRRPEGRLLQTVYVAPLERVAP